MERGYLFFSNEYLYRVLVLGSDSLCVCAMFGRLGWPCGHRTIVPETQARTFSKGRDSFKYS